MTEWRDAVGFEGRYEVSSDGQVRNATTKHILKTQSKHGYRRINLMDNSGISRNCSVHRMVAKAFIANPDNKPQVNHIDGDHANNSIENLEWVTAQENLQHAIDNDLFRKGVERAKKYGSSGYNRKDKPKAYLKKSERITKGEYDKLIWCSEKLGVSVGRLANMIYNATTDSRLFVDISNSTIKPSANYSERYIQKIQSLEKELEASKQIARIARTHFVGTDVPECAIGEKRNHLTIIGYAKNDGTGRNLVCKCDCGKILLESTTFWLNGKVKSCGCQMGKLLSDALKNEPEKREWLYTSAWTRLHRKENCCTEWQDYDTFRKWAYENGYAEGMHLRRKDVYAGFNPENCYWHEKQEVSRSNNNAKRYLVNGEMLTMREICDKYDVCAQFITYRMRHKKMTAEEAVNTPKNLNGRPKSHS